MMQPTSGPGLTCPAPRAASSSARAIMRESKSGVWSLESGVKTEELFPQRFRWSEKQFNHGDTETRLGTQLLVLSRVSVSPRLCAEIHPQRKSYAKSPLTYCSESKTTRSSTFSPMPA